MGTFSFRLSTTLINDTHDIQPHPFPCINSNQINHEERLFIGHCRGPCCDVCFRLPSVRPYVRGGHQGCHSVPRGEHEQVRQVGERPQELVRRGGGVPPLRGRPLRKPWLPRQLGGPRVQG